MGYQQSIRRPNPVLSESVFEMFRMNKKVIIITGGTGGIGYQVARGLGHPDVGVDRNLSKDRTLDNCLRGRVVAIAAAASAGV